MLDGTLQGEVYEVCAEEVFVAWPGIEPGWLPPRYGVGHVLSEIPASPPLRIDNMHRLAASEFFDIGIGVTGVLVALYVYIGFIRRK